MDQDRVTELHLGFMPDAGASGAVLLQSEYSVFLLFNAVSDDVRPSGHLEDLGVGILEFTRKVTTRFGYPNDEGRNEHPLYHRGLSDIGYGVCEVLRSSWAAEWAAITRKSANRILGGEDSMAFKRWETSHAVHRHFLVAFHDSTFECVAADMKASVDARPWREVLADTVERLE